MSSYTPPGGGGRRGQKYRGLPITPVSPPPSPFRSPSPEISSSWPHCPHYSSPTSIHELGASPRLNATSAAELDASGSRFRPQPQPAHGSSRTQEVQPPTDQPWVTNASELPSGTKRCDFCLKTFPSLDIIRCPCAHESCRNCIILLFRGVVSNLHPFPVTCCSQEIPIELIESFASVILVEDYRLKEAEHNTSDGIYCSNMSCSSFLPLNRARANQVFCGGCGTTTCTLCKYISHEGPCYPRATHANEPEYRRCYACQVRIEPQQDYIPRSKSYSRYNCPVLIFKVCECGAEICCSCGFRWKTCNCPGRTSERFKRFRSKKPGQNQESSSAGNRFSRSSSPPVNRPRSRVSFQFLSRSRSRSPGRLRREKQSIKERERAVRVQEKANKKEKRALKALQKALRRRHRDEEEIQRLTRERDQAIMERDRAELNHREIAFEKKKASWTQSREHAARNDSPVARWPAILVPRRPRSQRRSRFCCPKKLPNGEVRVGYLDRGSSYSDSAYSDAEYSVTVDAYVPVIAMRIGG